MDNTLSEKVILITGATDGLGKLTAKYLAMQDATLILHGRNKEKGVAVANEISKITGNKKLKYYNADYASLKEVSELAERIKKDHSKLDILINNVGIGAGPKEYALNRKLSKDGYELRFQVNYLSHVLLTQKLVPILKQGSSKIINVASIGQEPIDFRNVMLEKGYEGFFAYKQSKTALIMFTFDLAEELKNKSIVVNALHPASLMNTKMVLDYFDYSMTTVEQGAEALLHLLTESVTGQFFDGKHVSRAIQQTYDPKSRENLRKLTAKLLSGF